MTDRPSPEQQLAQVIERVISTLDLVSDPPDVLAAAIVAAVNNGTIAPIVPDGWTSAADRYKQLLDAQQAELTELRALKAKVDGLTAVVGPLMGDRLRSSDGIDFHDLYDLLAWLRETTDG